MRHHALQPLLRACSLQPVPGHPCRVASIASSLPHNLSVRLASMQSSSTGAGGRGSPTGGGSSTGGGGSSGSLGVPTATAVTLHKQAKALEVQFSDGSTGWLSAELLRACSPSAENCSTSGSVKVPSGRRYVGIMSVEPVGSYGLRLYFDDLHSTGIYTWEYLWELQRNKWSRARHYLRQLREQGGSRNPPRRPAAGAQKKPAAGGGKVPAGGAMDK